MREITSVARNDLSISALHQGEFQKYTVRIVRKERNLLPLCIMEALYIEKQVVGTTLNDNNEYGRGKLIRIRVTREE